jgi:asparagine synthase (glutamine-hydrolysing)
MPGLFGVVGSADDHRVAQRFSALRSVMRAGARARIETQTDPAEHWAIGRTHLGTLQPAPQLGRGGSLHVLFNGDLHNFAELRTHIEQQGKRPPADVPELIAALYASEGLEWLPLIEGTFCAAILDSAAEQLVLVADRLGSYPLYWYAGPAGFTFASELRAVVRDHPRPTLDLETVATIGNLGFPFGQRTLAAGITLLPPATALTYDARTLTVSLKPYASLVPLFTQSEESKPRYLERLNTAFSHAMDHAVHGDAQFGLSLSGGLDTRVILSALDSRRLPVSTFTIGGKGCADEVIGDQLSRLTRTDHQFIELGDRYLGDLVPNMRRMVSLTDGMYISHGFTETLALEAFERSTFSVLLRGHAGELAKTSTAWPLHTDASINAMTSVDQFVPYLLRRLDAYYHGGSLRNAFNGAAAELFRNGHPRHTLQQAVGDAALAPADLCSYLYLHEYHRRVTVPSLDIFRHVVEVRVPLADPEFLRVVLQGRREWREGTEIHRALIGFNSRRLLRVRNPNTGARAGAGPGEEWVFDKLNSVLRRLNVYGYRHYHDFDGWMRRSFLDSIERVLLSKDALSRPHVHPDGVARLVAEAKQGMRTHDHVLQLLANVELWQQENL